jgi:hypothetical protein
MERFGNVIERAPETVRDVLEEGADLYEWRVEDLYDSSWDCDEED